jgi:hypothetical protein
MFGYIKNIIYNFKMSFRIRQKNTKKVPQNVNYLNLSADTKDNTGENSLEKIIPKTPNNTLEKNLLPEIIRAEKNSINFQTIDPPVVNQKIIYDLTLGKWRITTDN